MKQVFRISALMIAALMIVFFSTCKKDNPINKENPPAEWVIGTKTTIEIKAAPGTEVTEAVNGLTFLFPDGGTGNLEVAPIISGVAPPIAGQGFYIHFSGTDKIKLVISESNSGLTMVHGFGTGGALTRDVSYPQNVWVDISYDSIDVNKKAFMLMMPENGKSGMGFNTGFNYYNISKIDENTPGIEQYNLAVDDMRAMLARYIDSLPSPLKDTVMKRKKTLYWVLGNSFSACYEPFYYIDKGEISNQITVVFNATNPELIKKDMAHESGHYMMHLIAGTDLFYVLRDQMPLDTRNHGIGTAATRADYMIEESAYLSEYFQNGDVGGGNPEEPRPFLYASYNMPDVQDYPSIEGFGVVLFAGLHRTNPQILDVHAPYGVTRKIDFPVIGASFKDIFGILGRGSKSMDELRNDIAQYLVSKNKGQLVVPFLQRLGWGYHNVKMTITDPLGNKLSNISARSICITDGKTWYGPKNTVVTGDDGKYTLKGAFGGSGTENGAMNKIRFYRGTTDSADVAAPAIGWDYKTNQEIDWGIIGVDLENDIPPYLESKDYGIFVGAFTFDCPVPIPYPEYIPSGSLSGGPEDDYIVCQSNGAGSISINYTIEYPDAGSKETCNGSGSVIPHHTVHDFLDTYYYAFNINFTFKSYSNNQLVFEFDGKVSGIDHLDPYMNSDVVCTGTMTRHWLDNDQQPQSCSYQESFNNFTLHNFMK